MGEYGSTYSVMLPKSLKVPDMVLIGSRVTFNGVEVLTSNSWRLLREGNEMLINISWKNDGGLDRNLRSNSSSD